jgi:hypothetical protein
MDYDDDGRDALLEELNSKDVLALGSLSKS